MLPCQIERQVPQRNEVAHIGDIVGHIHHHPGWERGDLAVLRQIDGIFLPSNEIFGAGKLGFERGLQFHCRRDRPVRCWIEPIVLKQEGIRKGFVGVGVSLKRSTAGLAFVPDHVQPARRVARRVLFKRQPRQIWFCTDLAVGRRRCRFRAQRLAARAVGSERLAVGRHRFLIADRDHPFDVRIAWFQFQDLVRPIAFAATVNIGEHAKARRLRHDAPALSRVVMGIDKFVAITSGIGLRRARIGRRRMAQRIGRCRRLGYCSCRKRGTSGPRKYQSVLGPNLAMPTDGCTRNWM